MLATLHIQLLSFFYFAFSVFVFQKGSVRLPLASAARRVTESFHQPRRRPPVGYSCLPLCRPVLRHLKTSKILQFEAEKQDYLLGLPPSQHGLKVQLFII